MAQSIYETLASLKTETSVPEIKDKEGKVIRRHYGMVSHTLPSDLLPSDEIFENADALTEWADEKGITHACLQKGIAGFIIDLRAIFKGVKKDETWTPEYGQAQIDSAEWKVMKRPEKKVDTKKAVDTAVFQAGATMAKNMLATKGVSEKMVVTALTATYGADMTEAIMASIKENSAE